jgi:hypothetical protein
MSNYFNPVKVEYLPNSGITENAGALGKSVEDAFMKNYMLNYQKKQDEIKALHDADVLAETQRKNSADMLNNENKLAFDWNKLVNDIQKGNDTSTREWAKYNLNSKNSALEFEQFAGNGAAWAEKNPELAQNVLTRLGVDTGKLTKENYAALGKLLNSENNRSGIIQNTDRYNALWNDLAQYSRDNNFNPDDILSGNFLLNSLPVNTQNTFKRYADEMEMINPKSMMESDKKELRDISQLVSQASGIVQYMNEHPDDIGVSGPIDSAWNLFNQYFGFGDKKEFMKKVGGEGNYHAFRNTILKVMSGTAVSENEYDRFKLAFGTLWQNDEAMAAKLFNGIRNINDKVNLMKESSNRFAFSVNYGGLMDKLKTTTDTANSLERYLMGETNGEEYNQDNFINSSAPSQSIQSQQQSIITPDGIVLIDYGNGQRMAVYPDGRTEKIQ